MYKVFLFVGIFCLVSNGYAQYRLANSYTTKEGLPHNSIYKCIEDDKGFLWIATEQGLARFDGIRFQWFSTAQGLPDNSVLVMFKEKNGLLWVQGQNGEFAYFDTTRNRFLSSHEVLTLARLNGHSYSPPIVLPDGGLSFPLNDTTYFLKDGNLKLYPEIIPHHNSHIVWYNKDSSEIRYAQQNATLRSSLFLTKNNRLLDSCILFSDSIKRKTYMYESRLFITSKNSDTIIMISSLQLNPLRVKKTYLKLSEKYYWHNFTSRYIMMIFPKGNVDVYDANDLTLKFSFDSHLLLNSVFDDSHDNFWLSSFSSGLLMYKKNSIFEYELPAQYKNVSWLSVLKTRNGKLLVGNSSGEIVESDGKNIVSHKLVNAKNTDIERHILEADHKLFSLGEGGMYVNYTKEIKRKNHACKTAFCFNDSIILCGFKDGFGFINAKTETMTELKNATVEASCFAGMDQTKIYVGSQNGLHVYDLVRQQFDTISKQDPMLKERIVAMTMTQDSLLWIATANNGLIVVKHDQVLTHITAENGLRSNHLLTIAVGRPHQIWVATNTGISMIDYSAKHPTIQNLSVHDGLTSNIINQFYYKNDTMFAATENGVSVIPANIVIPTFDIPVELTGVSINNRDTILQHEYSLKSNQNNINVQFAGVELSGHFRNAQLSVDEGLTWSDIEGNNVSLQLTSGAHRIWLRAIDVNGHIGNQLLKIQFDIDTPFYKTWWFVILVLALITGAIFFVYTRSIRRKHQQRIDEYLNQQMLDEFEIQALKAQINPHFVFNCLNSIRGFIYNEDFKNADLYLQRFSQVLRSALNFSSQTAITILTELEFIETYLMLEKLRFGTKFEYSINVKDEILQSKLLIPAMLLQPFIENAIIHGIGNLKNRTGIILINVYLANDKLNITIDDNGIGREKATELKQQRKIIHASKGLLLTQRRIELYHIECETIDKKDEKGEGTGTLIHLKIPVPLM